MIIYTQLENNLEKLKLTATKEYLPNYLNNNDLSLVEALEWPTAKEITYQTGRLAKMSIHITHFPYDKGLNDFDFNLQPSVDKNRIMNLKSMNFVSLARNILFIGSSGVGKMHLVAGLGMEVCRNHLSTYFANCHELTERLKLTHQEDRLEAILKNYSRYKLLITDEIGYLPIDDLEPDPFFQLIARRYEKESTITTTNISLSKWGQTLSNPTIANTTLGRLAHRSEIFKITGKPYRMKDYQEQQTTETNRWETTFLNR